MIDENAPRFGLPNSLLVPIAASDVNSIEQFVGTQEESRRGRDGRILALAVRPHPRERPAIDEAPLWIHAQREEFERRLFPERQIWVHVDYRGYRNAYLRMNGPAIPEGYFLDHIQNRAAVRLRWYSHPYLRLCPVSRTVNTSGGHATGGEGMEKDYLREMRKDKKKAAEFKRQLLSHRIIYADPMDLTKILDKAPGTHVLDGVRVTQSLFYPGGASGFRVGGFGVI
jgi:hypothetical protein